MMQRRYYNFGVLVLTLMLILAAVSCGRVAALPEQDGGLGVSVGLSRIEPYSELVWAQEGNIASDGLMSAWSVPDVLSMRASQIPLVPWDEDTGVQITSGTGHVTLGDTFAVYSADFSHVKDVTSLREVWRLYENGALSGTVYIYFTATKTGRNASWCRGCFVKTDFSK